MPFRMLLTLFYICIIIFTISVSVTMLTYGVMIADARGSMTVGVYLARKDNTYIVKVKDERTCLLMTTDAISVTQKKIGQPVEVLWVDMSEAAYCTPIEDYLENAAARYWPLIGSVAAAFVMLVVALCYEYRYYKERKIKESMEMLMMMVR